MEMKDVFIMHDSDDFTSLLSEDLSVMREHGWNDDQIWMVAHATRNYDALTFAVEKLRKENEMLKKTRGMQPVLFVDGVIRFKKNRIVDDILSHSRDHGFGLNQIALGDYSDEEHTQLAQLIGYSVSGFGSLSYVSESMFEIAHEMAAEISK
ncbi:MAG: hypothetical protein ACRCVE_02060 [Plesiomonas sp.]